MPEHRKERRLPDGSVALIFNLHEDQIRIFGRHNPEQFQSYRGSIMSGAHSVFSILDTTSQSKVIGIKFRAEGALPFLQFPVTELHNEILSLDQLWGARVYDLYGDLREARTLKERFSLLEQFLLTQLATSHICHPAVPCSLKRLTEAGYTLTVSELSEHVGLSTTRYIQIFGEAVGLTPRQFIRLRRFQRALRLLNDTPSVRGADLALICGYFDQAHFIHDFQSFSGLTPGAYLSLQGEFRNHVPISE